MTDIVVLLDDFKKNNSINFIDDGGIFLFNQIEISIKA